MQGAAHGKQAERTAGALAFVNIPRIQGHGNRIGFIDARIPELAVNQNCERDDRSLAIRTELNDSQGAWSGVFLTLGLAFSRDNLWTFLLGADGPHKQQAERQADDDRGQNARRISAV